ncbi:carbohydrate ABC transporter permease [Advenella mimigardefordensis]|uniref:Putative ABC transporter permease protein n=1 Tax=Advenella mimigardefordensis (strain DSM 17166 / LMG 22922 / DPN7) TaxID=1247726 RepID=W0PK35_ADVMD|nr:carbohydrate ABC transporter permease [Advenella mimigardefordensis]AHG65348.1 putative ABC transporter permease protein [Advenella mimigardefordensis DPN7]
MTPQAGFSSRLLSQVTFSSCLRHGVLLALALIMLFPFYWMIVTAFRPAQEVFSGSFSWLPQQFVGWDNFRTALADAPLLRYMLNGAIVCLGVLLVQLATAIPCGWALARYRFRGDRILFGAVLLGLCIPIQVPAIPLFLGLAATDMLNTYFALMVPFFLSVFAIFLFRQSFRIFPEDIVQAARLDGLSEMAILWQIVVPASKPAIAAFSVFSVTSHWNDLYWPLIVITNAELMTPPLGLASFADPEIGANFGALMASATIVTLPLMILYLFIQRHFIQGVTNTGVK